MSIYSTSFRKEIHSSPIMLLLAIGTPDYCVDVGGFYLAHVALQLTTYESGSQQLCLPPPD